MEVAVAWDGGAGGDSSEGERLMVEMQQQCVQGVRARACETERANVRNVLPR